jgi:hypothetical protein
MRLGTFGVWQPSYLITAAMAREIEQIGFHTLWIGGEGPELNHAAVLLGSTQRLVVGTSILNIWEGEPTTTAEAYRRLSDRFRTVSCWVSVSAIASRARGMSNQSRRSIGIWTCWTAAACR